MAKVSSKKMEGVRLLPLADLIGWGLAVAFVAVSLLMAVACAWTIGAPSGMSIPFAAIAVAVVGFKALGLTLTFGRGQRAAGFIALPLVLICYAFTVTAGHHFARANLYTAANQATAQSTAYETARERVTAIRGELAGIHEARDPATIRTEIEAKKQHARWLSTKGCTDATVAESFSYCQEYGGLQTALAVTEKRERLKLELDAKVGELNRTPSAAGATHDAGPVAAIVTSLTGYSFATFEDFFAWLVVLAVELGDIIAPFVMAMAATARGEKPVDDAKAQAAKIMADVEAREEANRIAKTSQDRKQEAMIARLYRFLEEVTERAQDAEIGSEEFHTIYKAWELGNGNQPMTMQRFGTLITRELKIPKVKRKANIYLGVRIRKDWHAKPVPLRVAGGKG